jgi:hypothetical protein
MSKAWKEEEARIASYFGHIRRPGSGAYAHIGTSDTMLPDGRNAELYIEVKSQNAHNLGKKFLELLGKTETLALKEAAKECKKNKPWALVIHEKKKQRRYAIIDFEQFVKLWLCWCDWQSKHKPPERVNVLNYVPKDCLCYEEAKP